MSADFEALRVRLASAIRGSNDTDDPARTAAVLHERRQALASRRLEESPREVFNRVVVVRRGAVLLGIPINAAAEVREVEVTAVPGAGRVVDGVFQVRGRCTGLVDLESFFSQEAAPRSGRRSLIVVVSGGPGRLGLCIDEIVGVRTLYVDELESSLGETRLTFIRRITHDGVHVVDIDALMSMPEIRITGGSVV